MRDEVWKQKRKSRINTNAWTRLKVGIQAKYNYDIDFKPRASKLIVDLKKKGDEEISSEWKKKLEKCKYTGSSSKMRSSDSLTRSDVANTHNC